MQESQRQERVEVKIGIQHAPRELVLEMNQPPTDVMKTVNEALADETGVLSLVDDKGRWVIVPVSKLAYVEIAGPSRPMGFAT